MLGFVLAILAMNTPLFILVGLIWWDDYKEIREKRRNDTHRRNA